MTRRALCQDCLRVFPCDALIVDRGDPPGRCPVCDGQACDCFFCMSTLDALEGGARGKVRGLTVPIVAWSATDGARTIVDQVEDISRERRS